jgi:hypothetical protein
VPIDQEHRCVHIVKVRRGAFTHADAQGVIHTHADAQGVIHTHAYAELLNKRIVLFSFTDILILLCAGMIPTLAYTCKHAHMHKRVYQTLS